MNKIPLIGIGPHKRTNHLVEKDRGMHVPVTAIIRRPPVTVTPDASIRVALETMERSKIGSIIVVSPENQVPQGILTLQDVLRRIALPQPDLESPISAVMSGEPVSLGIRSTVHQAALLMARRNLRHVLITDDTHRLIGIVSKNDLYDMMCSSCASVRNAQRRATAEKIPTHL